MPTFIFLHDEQYAELSTELKFGMSLVPFLAALIGCKTIIEFEMTGLLTTLILWIAYVVCTQEFVKKTVLLRQLTSVIDQSDWIVSLVGKMYILSSAAD